MFKIQNLLVAALCFVAAHSYSSEYDPMDVETTLIDPMDVDEARSTTPAQVQRAPNNGTPSRHRVARPVARRTEPYETPRTRANRPARNRRLTFD